MDKLSNFLRGRRCEAFDRHDLDVLSAGMSEPFTIAPRAIAVVQGAPVTNSTMLIDGLMCRYMDDRAGHRQLVALHFPGDFVDLHAYPLRRLDHDLAALTEATVATIPHDTLADILADRPRLTRALWFATLLDAAAHREWIFRLGRLAAIGRVAHFMSESEVRMALIGRSDGTGYALPMTQNDLAEACGLTPVHVNRTLRELREKGLAEFQGQRVRILDRAGLHKVAEFDPQYLYIDRP